MSHDRPAQSARADIREWDATALWEALDERRRERGLTWSGVAAEIWQLSAELNARRPTDHPISPSTLTSMRERRETSCQHALFFLRWLEERPETFLRGGGSALATAPLPPCGPDRRLRWNLRKLHRALDDARRERRMTWRDLAADLRCSPNQLSGIGNARFAIGMRLAMRVVQWLGRPAADFVYPALW